MFSLICARINGWMHTGEAGDLRRLRANYDVIVMLQKLFIIGKPIEDIHEFAFRGLNDLQELFIRGCQLTTPPPIAPISRTLRHLGVGNNNFTHIPADYFTGFNLLDTVAMGQNRLSSVPDVQILNATLKSLTLCGNFITHIESLYLVPMLKLKILDLARNLLTEIDFDKTIWPSIQVIGLESNRLTSIETSGLRKVWRKVLVKVTGNPWHCDVELCWLSRCHYRMGNYEGVWSNCRGSERVQMFGDIVCNSPEERRNVILNKSGKESYGINA